MLAATVSHNGAEVPDSDLERSRASLCALVNGEDRAALDAPLTPELVALAREERVHLLIADRLRTLARQSGATDVVSRPDAADLLAELRPAAVIDAARQAELRTVLGALARADAPALVIKGAAVAWTHYERPELRPRADTDLLIADAHRDRVAAALAALGYTREPGTEGRLITSQFHFQKRDRAGIEHRLDVHWRISNARAFADALSYAELLDAAVPLPALGPDARAPSAVHALLLACIHRVAHHIDSTDLLWLYDIALLARACTARERAQFVRLASERRMRAVCARNLELAAEAFGGIGAEWLGALAPSSAAEPSAAFLASGLAQIDVLRADLAATPGWHRRVQLIGEHLFPRPAFMYERYRTRQPLALPFLYLHRVVTGWPKWFRR